MLVYSRNKQGRIQYYRKLVANQTESGTVSQCMAESRQCLSRSCRFLFGGTVIRMRLDTAPAGCTDGSSHH
jgi:hypothetical protein